MQCALARPLLLIFHPALCCRYPEDVSASSLRTTALLCYYTVAITLFNGVSCTSITLEMERVRKATIYAVCTVGTYFLLFWQHILLDYVDCHYFTAPSFITCSMGFRLVLIPHQHMHSCSISSTADKLIDNQVIYTKDEQKILSPF